MFRNSQFVAVSLHFPVVKMLHKNSTNWIFRTFKKKKVQMSEFIWAQPAEGANWSHKTLKPFVVLVLGELWSSSSALLYNIHISISIRHQSSKVKTFGHWNILNYLLLYINLLSTSSGPQITMFNWCSPEMSANICYTENHSDVID